MKPFMFIFMILCIAACGVFGCSSGLKLTSTWQSTVMTIDGNDTEWQSDVYYDAAFDMVYGVRNDEENMYLFLKTQNRATQTQMLRGGFTVWFDPAGGKDKAFGIRYPLAQERGALAPADDGMENLVRGGEIQASLELEILGPRAEDIQRISKLEAHGIAIHLLRTNGVLVYELCVPLQKSSLHPFAIDVRPGKRVGVGFTSSEFKRPERSTLPVPGSEMGDEQGRQGEGGGMEGYGRSRGGHRGGGANLKPANAMDLWLAVQLVGTRNSR
jgi:hypothetical protein